MKKNLALIFGGEGREHEISVKSAKNLYAQIDREKYDVIPIFVSKTGDWYIKTAIDGEFISSYPVRYNGKSGFLLDSDVMQVDGAILILHGDFGEDGRVQGALDTAHIRYIGCGVGAGAVASDKILTKACADALGVKTAKWVAFTDICSPTEAKAIAEEKLSYPMIIKPSGLGSSIGISRIYTPAEFISAFLHASSAYGTRVLIEELIDVDYEVECAYLSIKSKAILSPCGRISGGGFYDFDSKYNKSEQNTATIEMPDKEIEEKITDAARRICDFIGVHQMARIDFLVSRDGEVYFNEINTIPGMTDSSLYPRICESMGLRRGEFINLLIDELIDDRGI